MKIFWIAVLCLVVSAPALAQTADEPASRDDIMLYLRIMHSHDLMQKTMEVQSKSMQQLLLDQIAKEKGGIPPDFQAHMQKLMDELVKGMPVDEITQLMIPAYQKHFTKSDIEAMNAFYSSPVGQKVLEELPAVMQEGMQAAMPLMSKYLSEWQDRMKQELKKMDKSAPKTAEPASSSQN